jgi:hypothetical protein
MSLRENQALQIQPRRGGLKVAQDAVLGWVRGEISSPVGTAESIFARFSRPSGTNRGCDLFPGLASWATFRSPLRGWSCKTWFSGRSLLGLNGPAKVVP